MEANRIFVKILSQIYLWISYR